MGSRCLVEVEVGGAASSEAAGAVALAVARSSAVCAAVQACNPDWLTIADAARWVGWGDCGGVGGPACAALE